MEKITMHKTLKPMEEATLLAYKAGSQGEIPIGAVIVRNGKIISKAYNKREKSQIATHHAEILAIQKACKKLKSWRLDDCDLYVTLEPCPMCAGAIINARIKKVYFGARDLKCGALGGLFNLMEQKGFNHYFDSEFVEDAKCGRILSEFFKKKREIKKEQKNSN